MLWRINVDFNLSGMEYLCSQFFVLIKNVILSKNLVKKIFFEKRMKQPVKKQTNSGQPFGTMLLHCCSIAVAMQ